MPIPGKGLFPSPPPPPPPPVEPPPEGPGRPWMLDPNDPSSVIPAPGYQPLLGTVETGMPFSGSAYVGEEAEEAPVGADPDAFGAWRRARGITDYEYEGLPSAQKSVLFQQWWGEEGAGAPEEGAAPPLLSLNEERMMIDLQNAIKIGEMDEGQAWKVIENYWSKEQTQTRRAEEAGRRGETLLAGAHPGPHLPGFGPSGPGAALAKKWGGPNLTPVVSGIPMSQAQGVYGQAQEQMGLPSQLPPIEPPQFQLPNWQAMGQGMPNFGGTNYFEQLLKEGRMTAPGL